MREIEAYGAAVPDMSWMDADLIDAGTALVPRAAGERTALAAAPPTIRLFGRDFCVGRAADILAATAARPAHRPRVIVTANVDHIVQLDADAEFRGAYDRASARTLDGMPLVWLARVLHRLPVERVTGHDLLACVLAGPPPAMGRVFLVCARQSVADAVGARFRAAGLPPEAIASAVPPFGFEHDPAYGLALAARIRAHGAGLVVMGVGAPKSEVWVDRHAGTLGGPVVLCVGDALAVAAGCMPRAPRLMQRLGLEWAFRFALAPRRLFHRYFVKSWRFLEIAARQALG